MKVLLDVDEMLLADAQFALGTSSVDDTVNEALIKVVANLNREELLRVQMNVLAKMPLLDRKAAWE